ncbi:MAG: hypothetical protein MJB14_13440 [Spirochaetes bacterium]|nr:hypothetical protein [Spirochaetota bacterium]
MKIPVSTRKWLIESEIPYIRYNAKKFFNPTNKINKKELYSDPFIQENIKLLNGWKTEILKRHNDSGLLIHRLALLADLGIEAEDQQMKSIIMNILSTFNQQCIPELLIEIPKAFGGSGEPGLSWIICDYPVVLYALLKMKAQSEELRKSVKQLRNLVADNGYRCLGSIPKFKGPGPGSSICPYANLLVAKALSYDAEGKKSEAFRKAINCLLNHWSEQKEKKYFMFGIGTDFKKIKFPLVWYNLLNFLELFSRLPEYHDDQRIKEMVKLLVSKLNNEMKIKPESMYRIYKNQDFANKKDYSPTITLIVLQILIRFGIINLS